MNETSYSLNYCEDLKIRIIFQKYFLKKADYIKKIQQAKY